MEAVFLVGSWAARHLGELGPEPGREVNPTIVSRRRWEEANEGFIRTVRSRPHVALDPGRPGPDAR